MPTCIDTLGTVEPVQSAGKQAANDGSNPASTRAPSLVWIQELEE